MLIFIKNGPFELEEAGKYPLAQLGLVAKRRMEQVL